MKIIFYFIFATLFASCCLGSRKCAQDINDAQFRIASKANGQDLLFGPSKIYDPTTIRVYSLSGTHTVFHNSYARANPNPSQDSLFSIDFDYRKIKMVFVKLNNIDTDTMELTYNLKNLDCCESIILVKPFTYNTTFVQNTGGFYVLNK